MSSITRTTPPAHSLQPSLSPITDRSRIDVPSLRARSGKPTGHRSHRPAADHPGRRGATGRLCPAVRPRGISDGSSDGFSVLSGSESCTAVRVGISLGWSV